MTIYKVVPAALISLSLSIASVQATEPSACAEFNIPGSGVPAQAAAELANGFDAATVVHLIAKLTSFSYGVDVASERDRYRGTHYDGTLSCPNGGDLYFNSNDSGRTYLFDACTFGPWTVSGQTTSYVKVNEESGYASMQLQLDSEAHQIQVKNGAYKKQFYRNNNSLEAGWSFTSDSFSFGTQRGIEKTQVKNYVLGAVRDLKALSETRKTFSFVAPSTMEIVEGSMVAGRVERPVQAMSSQRSKVTLPTQSQLNPGRNACTGKPTVFTTAF